MNSGGDVDFYDYYVGNSYGKIRSPYVYYRDDYHAYQVRSDGVVDNNGVVWDSYGL